ncbi:hypothetical protein Vafri_6734 [Volvox africanus]|uniref:Uncharacterized protein n=1 Tax=Volvox africanus TaxID=51714 RepID=A0A8J4AZS8_9CHLO|nr:hypothetical protein Vafri_6734 [Volvox africanus]
MWKLLHFPQLQSSTLPTKKQATVCKCPPKHVTYSSCSEAQHIVRAIGATGATLLLLTSGAFASFASVDQSALSTSSEHSPTLLVLERRKVEDLVISEFADGLAEMSDTELVELLEEILRNRRENSSKPFWKIEGTHAESSFLSVIPSETSDRASKTFNVPTSTFQSVDGSLENGGAPRASDVVCARAVEGGESNCSSSSVGTAQVGPAKGGELQESRSTEAQLLDAGDNVRQPVMASEVSIGVDEVNYSTPMQRSDEGRSSVAESEIGRDKCDTSPDSASSTGSCYNTSSPSPVPANVQNSSDMLEQNWWPAKEWMTGTLFTTTPSLRTLCSHSQGSVEGDSILQSILPLMLDLCESVDTKPTLPLVALMGGLGGLVAWVVAGFIQTGAIRSSTAFLESKLPRLPSLVAKRSAADQDSAISASAGTSAPDPSLPILDNLSHGSGAATLRNKKQDLSQPSVAEGARTLGNTMSTQGSRAGARIADPKLRKLLDNGPPPPQFLGAHAGWWGATQPGSRWPVGLNGSNVGQMQHVGGPAAQQEDPSWSCDSPSETLGQKGTERPFVYKAAAPDPWVGPSRGSVSTQQYPSDWQLWQTASPITEPESFSPKGKTVSPWDS